MVINTADEMILQQIATLIDMVGDSQQLVNHNITTLIDIWLVIILNYLMDILYLLNNRNSLLITILLLS